MVYWSRIFYCVVINFYVFRMAVFEIVGLSKIDVTTNPRIKILKFLINALIVKHLDSSWSIYFSSRKNWNPQIDDCQSILPIAPDFLWVLCAVFWNVRFKLFVALKFLTSCMLLSAWWREWVCPIQYTSNWYNGANAVVCILRISDLSQASFAWNAHLVLVKLQDVKSTATFDVNKSVQNLWMALCTQWETRDRRWLSHQTSNLAFSSKLPLFVSKKLLNRS